MKKRILAVLASLVIAVPLSLQPTIQAIAEPIFVEQTKDLSLSEYMQTVYKTTEYPELDKYVFQAFNTIENNRHSKKPIVVYTGDYESCRIFREYFNYAYGFTYEFRLKAYRTSGSSDFVVALYDVENIEQKIENYLSEVRKSQGIAKLLATDDVDTSANNIFNWVRTNVRYDFSLHGKATDDEMLRSYYGFHSGNPTICKGFSMAVYQLCSMNGIPATLETGTFNGGPHAWNTVMMNGGVRYVDVLNEQNIVSSNLPTGYVKQ